MFSVVGVLFALLEFLSCGLSLCLHTLSMQHANFKGMVDSMGERSAHEQREYICGKTSPGKCVSNS